MLNVLEERAETLWKGHGRFPHEDPGFGEIGLKAYLRGVLPKEVEALDLHLEAELLPVQPLLLE